MARTGGGHWTYHEKKLTVEECWAIDVSDVVRAVELRSPGHSFGYIRPIKVAARKTAPPILCTTGIGGDDKPLLGISYTVDGGWGLEHRVEEVVRLLITRPNFGGVRWWFSCPRVAGGNECGRRVGKLYRPAGGQHFACRSCLDLTYESCQRSHRYDGLWKSISAGEAVVEEMLKEYSSNAARKKRKRAIAPSLALLDAFDGAFGKPAAIRSPSGLQTSL